MKLTLITHKKEKIQQTTQRSTILKQLGGARLEVSKKTLPSSAKDKLSTILLQSKLECLDYEMIMYFPSLMLCFIFDAPFDSEY